MLVRPSGRLVSAREAQPLNAQSPMLVRPSGRLVSVREVQPKKACSPMLVRPSGRLVRAREVQPSKAWSPTMLVRPSGRLVSVREVQLPKARSPIQRQDTQDKTHALESDEQEILCICTVNLPQNSAYGHTEQCLRGDSKTVLTGRFKDSAYGDSAYAL